MKSKLPDFLSIPAPAQKKTDSKFTGARILTSEEHVKSTKEKQQKKEEAEQKEKQRVERERKRQEREALAKRKDSFKTISSRMQKEAVQALTAYAKCRRYIHVHVYTKY